MATLAQLPDCLMTLVLNQHLTLAQAWAALETTLLFGEVLNFTQTAMLLEDQGNPQIAQVLWISEELGEWSTSH